MSGEIDYSDKYEDDHYEYRHVTLPDRIRSKIANPPRLMSESEWRGLGIQQSRGWAHYAIYAPEPHVFLFRRPLGTNPQTGVVDTRR